MISAIRSTRRGYPRGLVLILIGLLTACQSQPAPTPGPTAAPTIQSQPTLGAGSTAAPTVAAQASPAATPNGTTPATATMAAASVATTVAASPVANTGAVLLFGPFDLPPEKFGPPFTGAFVGLQPKTAQATLDAARAAGFHLMVNLAGGRPKYQDATKAFSPTLFKQRLDAYRGIDLASYVADGTVVGHIMFDEPQDPTNWNGQTVPFEDIETAAAYSKALWPTLPVGVGGPPEFLKGAASWHSLDFALGAYTTKAGPADQWLKQEVDGSQQLGLGLALSINVLQGNDRGQATAEQLNTWGKLFASDAHVCALLMWKYDPAYFGGPGLAEAFGAVTGVSQHRPAVRC